MELSYLIFLDMRNLIDILAVKIYYCIYTVIRMKMR